MPDSALTVAPHALLLDFGGVIFQTAKRPTGRDDFAARIVERAARGGWEIEHARVRASLDAALTALRHWKHASSRRRTPREMTHREIVADFVAADLPGPVRALLVAEAGEVLEEMNTTLSDHALRPGIRDVIAEATARGIRLGIVSNAHAGRSHRAILAEHGLDTAFGVQVYSDEVGMRKPHPGMIELAATALGVTPAQCWYVGDTQDRDVVAGRRAGVGGMILTTSGHTDNPPFAVVETADAVFPTPEGLAELLRSAVAPASAAPAAATEPEPTGAPVLMIDHGGVISTTVPDAALLDAFASHLARMLDGPDEPVDLARAHLLIAEGRARHAERKRAQRQNLAGGGTNREVGALEFWRDLVGADLSVRARAVLTAEADDLMFRYGRAKSRRTLRTGVAELLEHCRAEGVRVVVVSNTVSGRAVRAECAAHGIDPLIGAYVCSDENGYRKPDPRIVEEALRITAADPARTWFLGDKPQNDALAAQLMGIARRVIVRGGTTDDDAIDAAVRSGEVTDVVSEPGDLIDLLAAPARI